MWRTRPVCRVEPRSTPFVLLFLILLCTPLFAQPLPQRLTWNTALNWLPVDTQTLVVAARPFVFESPMDTLQIRSLGGIDEFPSLTAALSGKKLRFALAGVRRFKSFSGLGLGPWDGCAVLAFAEPLGESWRSATSSLTKEDWSGISVLSLSTPRLGTRRTELEELHLFIAQLSPDILAIGNDRESLKILLDRRTAAQPDRALPASLREWKEVDFRAPAWAIRHYQRPVGFPPSINELEDPGAIDLVYNAQPEGPLQKVFWRSDNPRTVEAATRLWTWKQEGLNAPKVRMKPSGLAEILVPTPSEETGNVFALLLLTNLGYQLAM